MNQDVKNITKQVEAWLKNPIDTTIEESVKLSDTLLEKLREVMHVNADAKKVLGSLIGRVKGTQNALRSLEQINWVNVLNGNLAIGHRPSSKLMNDLRLYQTTHVLTLLSDKEGGKKIEALSAKNEINWRWFPMESAKPPVAERHEELAQLFSQMKEILINEGKIYIHCSAGIHRTGMISYALLRYLGNDSQSALSTLAKLRDKTSEGVGEERVEWGESIYEKLQKLSH